MQSSLQSPQATTTKTTQQAAEAPSSCSQNKSLLTCDSKCPPTLLPNSLKRPSRHLSLPLLTLSIPNKKKKLNSLQSKVSVQTELTSSTESILSHHSCLSSTALHFVNAHELATMHIAAAAAPPCSSSSYNNNDTRTTNSQVAILLDVRGHRQFVDNHIIDSFNLPMSTFLNLQNDHPTTKEMCENETKCTTGSSVASCHLIIYDDEDTSLMKYLSDCNLSWHNILSLVAMVATVNDINLNEDKSDHRCGLLHNLMNSSQFILTVLEGGFQRFVRFYPELCVNGNRSSHPSPHSCALSYSNGCADLFGQRASKILPFLYLGNEFDARDRDYLHSNDVHYILNVTHNLPFLDEKAFHCHRIPLHDSNTQELKTYWMEAYNFIEKARLSGHGILVHCQAGISRSAVIVMSYLMLTRSLSLNEAYDFVRQYRPSIGPNFNFLGQLMQLEDTHVGSNSILTSS